MYKRGDLQATVPPCPEMLADPDGECFSGDHAHAIRDARGRDDNPVGTVFLPHSCDAWVIGGPEQVKDLIDDLLALLDKTK